jgi:pilus assembly protein Flp/PilA
MRLLRIVEDETGATAIEYSLIAALIAIACIIAFRSLGLNLTIIFETIAAAMRR